MRRLLTLSTVLVLAMSAGAGVTNADNRHFDGLELHD
jgi:hypothetical protein